MEIENVVETVVKAMAVKAENEIPVNQDDYEKDGRLYCGKCNTPKQSIINLNGQILKPMCLCECAKKARRAKEEQEEMAQKAMRIEKYRKLGFGSDEMGRWTFANDDMANPKVTNAMRKYVENFAEMKRKGKGLLLYGPVGTGKTYHACEVANALIDQGIPCMVTNFARLANIIQGTFDKQTYIDSLKQFSLLVIDDLGAERQSEYMQEMVFNIIDARYRTGLPFIVTTNLGLDEIKAPAQVGNSRIYDRIIERCFPIEVTGNSRRKKTVRDEYAEMKEMLGL